MAKHPAAFINALSESRDFDLTIKHLQQAWDDYCEQRAEIAGLRQQLKNAHPGSQHPSHDRGGT